MECWSFFFVIQKSTLNSGSRAEAFKPTQEVQIYYFYQPPRLMNYTGGFLGTRGHDLPRIDFHGAFLLPHRAEADIGRIDVKIDALMNPESLRNDHRGPDGA